MWGRKTVNKLKTTPPLYSIHVSCLCNSIYFQRYWITTVKTSQELPMLSSVKKWPVSQSVIDIGHLQSCQTLLWRAENQEKKAHKLGRCYLHWVQNWLLTTLVILQLQTGSLKSECWEGPQSSALVSLSRHLATDKPQFCPIFASEREVARVQIFFISGDSSWDLHKQI